LRADSYTGLNGWVEHVALFVEHEEESAQVLIQKEQMTGKIIRD